jgi:hypothetical protein
MVRQDPAKLPLRSKELELGEIHPSPAGYQASGHPKPHHTRLLTRFFAFLSLFLVYKALSYDTTSKSHTTNHEDWIVEAFGYHGPHRDPGHPSRTELKEKLYLWV